MKSIKFMLLGLTLCGMTACADNSPKQFIGTIEDASMNAVVVKGADGQNVVFTTTDADKTQANGILLGNQITVDYKGALGENNIALKIATNATYANAIGNWTMVDPIAADSVMGVRLMVEGAAQSIRMATLRYSSWELQPLEGEILLKGVSEGSGEPIEFTQTAKIAQSPEGLFTLSIADTNMVLTKQAE